MCVASSWHFKLPPDQGNHGLTVTRVLLAAEHTTDCFDGFFTSNTLSHSVTVTAEG